MLVASTVGCEVGLAGTAATGDCGSVDAAYLDWLDVPEGITAEAVALAHVRDLEVQDRYGVRSAHPRPRS